MPSQRAPAAEPKHAHIQTAPTQFPRWKPPAALGHHATARYDTRCLVHLSSPASAFWKKLKNLATSVPCGSKAVLHTFTGYLRSENSCAAVDQAGSRR
jgi:hypothetical protein